MEKIVELGDALVQDNQERKFGGDPQYIVVWTRDNLKSELVPLVLTQEEYARAAKRAENNPEDIPELGSMAPINEFDSE